MEGEKKPRIVDEFGLAIEEVRNLIASKARGLTDEAKSLELVSGLKVPIYGFEINGISIEQHERRRGFRIPPLARGRIVQEIDLVVTGDEQQYEKAAPWSNEMIKGRLRSERYRFTFETDPSGDPTRLRSMRCEYENYDDFRGKHVWDGYGVNIKEPHGTGWFCRELLKTIPKILTSKGIE